MPQLWLLCMLCANAVWPIEVFCNEVPYEHEAHSISFNITQNNVANSWQSSGFQNGCFRFTVTYKDSAKFFRSRNTPDDFGYHWLLLQLTQPIRVLSVTVYAPNTDPNIAENIEIFMGHQRPTGLAPVMGSCYASLSSDVGSFTRCGVTEREPGRTSLVVTCRYFDCTRLTEFILLRSHVKSKTAKYMSFQALEITKALQPALVFNCLPTVQGIRNCRLPGLNFLKMHDEIALKICPPCQHQFRKASCRIKSPSGTTRNISTENSSESLVTRFSVSPGIQGGFLTCTLQCVNGRSVNVTERIGFIRWEEPETPGTFVGKMRATVLALAGALSLALFGVICVAFCVKNASGMKQTLSNPSGASSKINPNTFDENEYELHLEDIRRH